MVDRPSHTLSKLRIPRNDARGMLLTRLKLGEDLVFKHSGLVKVRRGLFDAMHYVDKDNIVRVVKADFRVWDADNIKVMTECFTTSHFSDDYRTLNAERIGAILSAENDIRSELTEMLGVLPIVGGFVRNARPGSQVSRELFHMKLQYLSSLLERIDLMEEDIVMESNASGSVQTVPAGAAKHKVFVVHGQDEEIKSIVARFLEHCGLMPVVLQEQTDRGRAIIEKFEEYTDVRFAVVLFTPDDVGGVKPKELGVKPQLQPRARQNVVLELGYFIGKLGRSNVCVLKKGNVEVPSNYSGIIYTPFGPDEGWKLKLARELKAAGLEVDTNKVFE